MLNLIRRYMLMVTPPLIGVLALLQLGRGLTPPVSVKGTWGLELGAPAAVNAVCRLDFGQLPPTLTVTQSGPQLQLVLNDVNKTTLSGEIRSSDIQAEGTAQGANAVRFEAKADPQPIPERLVGQVSVGNCATPATLEFTATRKLSGGQ